MANVVKTRQEIEDIITSWARESYDSVNSANQEQAAMQKAGLLKPMRVDLITLEEQAKDEWKARLALAGGRFDIVVIFWIDEIHELIENRLHIEDVEMNEVDPDTYYECKECGRLHNRIHILCPTAIQQDPFGGF